MRRKPIQQQLKSLQIATDSLMKRLDTEQDADIGVTKEELAESNLRVDALVHKKAGAVNFVKMEVETLRDELLKDITGMFDELIASECAHIKTLEKRLRDMKGETNADE